MYFGGPYRIIDFVLSNCINSGLRRIFIATQYKSLSLNRHIRMGWSIVSEELGEFVEILPPQKRVGEHWYQGTADAVYQNLYSILQEDPQHLIVLSGDHVYKMDYSRMLRFHRSAARRRPSRRIEVPVSEARPLRHRRDRRTRARSPAFRRSRRIRRRSPGRPTLRWPRWASTSSTPTCSSARSKRTRAQPTTHDFGKDIIPALIHEAPVYAYRFYDENKKAAKYWRDIGTLDAYFEANMDLCQVNPEFNLYDPEWPLRTYQPQAPPAKFVFAETGQRCGQALDSVISPGLHRLGQHAFTAACCARTCGSTASATSNAAS